jgi:hypothetical protein
MGMMGFMARTYIRQSINDGRRIPTTLNQRERNILNREIRKAGIMHDHSKGRNRCRACAEYNSAARRILKGENLLATSTKQGNRVVINGHRPGTKVTGSGMGTGTPLDLFI